jgi:hypothetical protein
VIDVRDDGDVSQRSVYRVLVHGLEGTQETGTSLTESQVTGTFHD